MKTPVNKKFARTKSGRKVFALALLTASLGLAACHDGHPDRGDHPHDHDGH